MLRKRILAALVLAAVPLAGAEAQSIMLGAKLRDYNVKRAVWLRDCRPSEKPFTFVEFFHTSNTSPGHLRNLFDIATDLGEKMNVVVITRESEQATAPHLAPFLNDTFGAVVDTSGETFNAFGVMYLPFGVLIDSKQKVRWMGNSSQMDRRTLERIFQRKRYQKR